MKTHMGEIDITKFCDVELIKLATELRNSGFSEDSMVRKLAKQYFNNDSAICLQMVAIIVLPVITERLNYYINMYSTNLI